MISYECGKCFFPMRLGQSRDCMNGAMAGVVLCNPVEMKVATQSIDMKPLKCPCPLACSAEGCHGKCPGSTSRAYQMERLKADMRTVPDPVVEAVRKDLLDRSRTGQAKYGTTMARTDVDLAGWVLHIYEELLDATNYAKRILMELEKGR